MNKHEIIDLLEDEPPFNEEIQNKKQKMDQENATTMVPYEVGEYSAFFISEFKDCCIRNPLDFEKINGLFDKYSKATMSRGVWNDCLVSLNTSNIPDFFKNYTHYKIASAAFPELFEYYVDEPFKIYKIGVITNLVGSPETVMEQVSRINKAMMEVFKAGNKGDVLEICLSLASKVTRARTSEGSQETFYWAKRYMVHYFLSFYTYLLYQ